MTLPEIKLALYRTAYIAVSAVFGVVSSFYVWAYSGIWCGEISRLFTHQLNPYQRADYMIDAHDWGEDICLFTYLAGFGGAFFYVGRKLGLFGQRPQMAERTQDGDPVENKSKNYTNLYLLDVKNDASLDVEPLPKIAEAFKKTI